MNYETESNNQKALLLEMEGEGRKLLEDNHNLREKVGTVQTVPVKFSGFTHKGLLKFYIKDEPNPEAFHLIHPEDWGVSDSPLEVGKMYEYNFVIGVRRVSSPEDGGYVISLRLPRTK
jgi:hypothetical protein